MEKIFGQINSYKILYLSEDENERLYVHRSMPFSFVCTPHKTVFCEISFGSLSLIR